MFHADAAGESNQRHEHGVDNVPLSVALGVGEELNDRLQKRRRVVVLVERLSRASVGARRETRIIIIIGTARRALRDALDVDDDARSARVSSRARRKDEERVSSRPSRAMRTSSSDPRGRERDGRVERDEETIH